MEAANDGRAPAAARALVIEGCLDAVTGGRAYGWARDPDRPEEVVEVEIRVGDQVLATVRADRARADLDSGGIGRHAFEVDLPDDVTGADVLALARLPDGAAVPLAVAGPPIADGTVPAPMLADLSGRIDRLRQDQRGLLQAQRATAGFLKDLAAQLPVPGQAGSPEDLIARMLDIAERQHALDRRMEALEVFLVRMDGTIATLGRGAAGPDVGRRGAVAGLDLRTAIAGLGCLAVIAFLTLLLALG